MIQKLFVGVTVLLFLFGCGGEVKQLQMRDANQKVTDPNQGMKGVEFPKGTWTGAASTTQAVTLAQMFVDSHNMAVSEFSKLRESQESIKTSQESIKTSQESLKISTQKLEETNLKILEAAQKHQENAQKTLVKIEELSKKQGSGEITLFFQVGSSKLTEKSMEYERLVRFTDFLARESKGRKIVLITIGSASAFGSPKMNVKLAKARADFPKPVIDKYLVNSPHEYYKVYGIGDQYSPKGVSKKEHERYQHTRVIALFENDTIPSLPEEAGKK
jgi:outer membrane protein OmpA-like peptidoglycan-associated protein